MYQISVNKSSHYTCSHSIFLSVVRAHIHYALAQWNEYLNCMELYCNLRLLASNLVIRELQTEGRNILAKFNIEGQQCAFFNLQWSINCFHCVQPQTVHPEWCDIQSSELKISPNSAVCFSIIDKLLGALVEKISLPSWGIVASNPPRSGFPQQ